MHKQHSMGYANGQKTDRGFYIILAICLVVIAVSGYVLFFSPSPSQADGLDQTVYTPTGSDLSETAAVAVPDVDVPAQPAQPVEPEKTAEPEADAAAEAPAQETAAQTEPAAPIWVRPVAGEVQKAFSGDTLVKDETMGDWRVHAGADYAATVGTRVYAVSDGTVDSVESDTLYGACVTMKLADGKTAVYRGLADAVKVKQGASVRAGDVIGTVGENNAAEATQASHLHFELMANGETINPETVFGGGKTTDKTEQKKQTGGAEVPIKVDTSAEQSGIDVEE